MTVNPGFGGQAFLPETLPEIAALRSRVSARGLAPHIEVDGGQNANTIGSRTRARADVIVAGTGIFDTNHYVAAFRGMLEAAA